MSDDSGDLSDFVDPSPSGSKGRLRSDQQKKKRRIVMRIEFDDSDEETTSSSSDSCNDGDDEQPSSSGTHKKHGRNAKQQSSNCAATVNSDDDSDQFRKNATKRLHSRRSNVLALDDGSSMDGSSSGSEIISQATKRGGKVLKKVIISEDEREAVVAQSPLQEKQPQTKPDDGFSSDSSSNELLEKCPICLLTFRKQEIGSPATCAHVFCANCIEAWSKNVQTCPIDRNEFDRIVVRESFENRNIVREIIVNKVKTNKEQELDADTVSDEEEDVTNCQICNSPEREDVMLLCDSCNEGYHIDCLTPSLDAIPEGSWYCDNCFDSNEDDEDDAVEEDLNMLYEDIRDMGIPQSRLRVTEVHQPRILRTRQNERIRAAVLRRTRASIARAEAITTTMTTTTARLGRQGAAQPATSTTTTATKSTTRRQVKKRKRRTKRRRARQRTYVVEYDLNNFDEKFAIKTTKKVIRRRRRKRTSAKKSARRSTASMNNSGGRRTTAKQRLAEQMGVKQDRIYINPSHATGAPSLSLFGNANDLEYFSDSDTGGGFENEIHIETGHGTAVQTSVRISNFGGTQRSRKNLLLGRLQRNQIGSVPAADTMPRTEAPIDILSNIMDMQDRWHTASRNLEAVRINADGTLQLPPGRDNANNAGILSTAQNPSAQNINANEVTQAPMYPQGSGSNQNFNSTGGGRYSNNNFNNQGRGGGGGGGGSGGGGSNQYRHSTGGMNSSGGGGSNLSSNFNLVGRGNFSFSNPDYNPNPNQGSNFMAFNNRDRDNREDRDDDRFNPRNRQQQNNSNNNQRNSFPFNNMPQQQQQQQPQQPQHQQQPPQHQQQPMHMDTQLFGGLPPPVQQLPPPMQQCLPPPMQSEHQLFGGLPPPMGPQMLPQNEQQLFGGLPPPIIQQHQIPPPQNEHQLFSSLPPPPTFEPQLPPAVQQHLLQPPGLPNMNIPPPINIVPVLRSAVPPPPAPPAALANWNSTLFSYAQDDDEDDSNCPNFSVYSAESQEVAKATVAKSSTNDGEVPKEDDENEDLVQLDDDDDIPMPPENNTIANSDLYEPENPTEEIDTENESEDETENKKEVEKQQNDISNKESDNQESQKIDKDIVEKQPIIAENANENHDEYDPEQETDTVVSMHDNDKDEQQEVAPEKKQVEEEEDEEEENEVEEDNEQDGGETVLEKITENDDQTAKSDDEAKEKNNTKETTVDAECNDTNDKPTECDARSPSPELSSLGGNKLQDADVTASNRKGVLELYDDSDWDELDIDRPRSTERMDDFITKHIEEENEKDREKVNEKQDKANESKDDKEEEEDRSYTPCLDEKNDPEDEPGSPAIGEAIVGGTPDLTPASLPNNVENGDKDDSEEEEGIIHDNADAFAGVETELISEDDENLAANNASSRRRKEKRSKRKNERSETFKKVSSKRKERNYRTEKAEKRRERMRGGSLPTSRSISRSRSNSLSRSRSPSRLRSRSRSRSNSRQKSPHGHRRIRKRRVSRSPLLRSSRSRSNDKENFIHFQNFNNQGFYGRFNNRGGFNNRFQHNRFNQRFQQRPRRRELPRYDVRNIVGHARNFNPKDRYGRDTSRPPRRSFSRSLSPARRRRSFSGSRSRSYSVSPKRKRRNSFSISPSPGEFHRRSPRRSSFSPPLRAHQRNRRSPISAMFRRKSQSPQRGRLSSPPRNIRQSRSVSPLPRSGGRKVTRHMKIGSPKPTRRQTSRSMSGSPRYTPRLSRSRSRSPRSMSPHKRQKNKKKKPKERKKKKTKKRIALSKSPVPVRRISRQRDPYEHDMLPAAAATKRKRHHSPQQALNNVAPPHNEEPTWSPSPSPPPIREYDNNVSWTPPLVSHHDVGSAFPDMFEIEQRRVSKPNSGKKEKRKRDKKKKKTVKRRDTTTGRKEKRRVMRRTETPEPAPSKEVFASGNNILVSVSFNKEAAAAAASQPPQQQTTVVTLPPTREDVISGIQRGSTDRQVTTIGPKKKRTHKRKKLDTKPVAIIDLERSPFQVHQEPADIIVLTDSDAANEDDLNEHEHHRGDRHLSESGVDEMEQQHHHRPQRGSSSGGGGGRAGSQHDQTPPMLSTIMEESYEVQQTGPKTPPEPPVIKFTLLNKQQTKVRNPLHDEVNDLNDDDMLDMEEEQMEQQQHRQDLDGMQSNQKIGPNTPPESGPCSPDVYDPFDPTKSPSLSPRSPTPPPLLLDKSQISIGDDSGPEIVEKHNSDEPNRQGERITQQQISSIGGATQNNAAPLNPVELVMALMSSKQQASNNQDMVNKSLESQYNVASSHMISNSSVGHDDNHGVSGMQEKSDDANSGGGAGITVLSNVLITASKSQHIPTISSPTPPMPTKSSQNLITKLPLPKVVTGSVGSGSGIGLPSNLRNGGGGGVVDDLFNDIESPYSPGSADYEDLFEPPPDTVYNAKRRSKRGKEKFDNLFGSSSPVGYLRLPSYAPSSKKFKSSHFGMGSRKLKVAKVGKSGDEQIKVYDDVPNSAVELQVKDKFLRKLNRQERVVEEVKLVLKPRFNRKQITKEDYKEIMRRAVPKICHSRSGEINPSKIKNLIEAYVKKFRAKHKKLNIINTGQVSSAVKCAAYLKKL